MKKAEVIVFAEGQTEEMFVKQIVAPTLRSLNVFVKPELLATSRNSKGGAVSYERLKFNAANRLKGSQNIVLTTFLDLYGLDTTFPGYQESLLQSDVYQRVHQIETELHITITSAAKCRPERFIPHIQPHEFEGLLFSDVEALCSVEPNWQSAKSTLEKIRQSVPSPEHINDSYETRPSRRLYNILTPNYRKTRHGPLAAQMITLERMESECSHLHKWMKSLRSPQIT